MRQSAKETEFRFYKFSPLIFAVGASGAAGFVMSFFIVFIPFSWIGVSLRIVIALVVNVVAVILAYGKASRRFSKVKIDHFKKILIFGSCEPKTKSLGCPIPFHSMTHFHSKSTRRYLLIPMEILPGIIPFVCKNLKKN